MWIKTILIVVITATMTFGQELEQKTAASKAVQTESIYGGKSLSAWIASIQNRDEQMSSAFEALRELGPRAESAVPFLTQIVAAPFTPIRIGVDDREAVLRKLDDIELRADAVDALAAIGENAVSATPVVIRWALTRRSVAESVSDSYVGLVIDLVTIDALERLRAASAIGNFGRLAAPAIFELLRSTDGERRKLGVYILGEGALPIANSLLKSRECTAQAIGIGIMSDMWPVVAKDSLFELKTTLFCEAKSSLKQ